VDSHVPHPAGADISKGNLQQEMCQKRGDARCMMPAVPPLLLEAAGITKSFEGVRALRGVSFDLRPGEVHALVGENGAGKSTLIKVMTGAVRPDEGTLSVQGRRIPHMTPAGARAAGIAAIYQQPSLFPQLTVAENIALALEGGRPWRRIDWRARARTAASLLARVGASIDPDRDVETLSMPEQQMVEIAKALGAEARILIMDEPTASLTDREAAHLLDVIGRLREQGAGIIYISHRLEEILAIADRVTVLRDGESVGTAARAGVDRAGLIRLMVGRELSSVFPKQDVVPGPVVLELRGIGHRASDLHDVSLTVRQGEILGLAGLVGSGRTELAEVVFGLRPADSGEILVRGARVRIGSPRDAIRAGIAYVPEDRRQHGVVLEMSVAANASLANLPGVSRRGIIDTPKERRLAGEFVDVLRIKTESIDADVGSLSGGNQQKVALARWLQTSPAVLILDEPTQGVDVGAKAEIHALMSRLAAQGVAILMISSEMPEILGMSDRIAVMRGGRVAGTLARDAASQPAILALAIG
jgi:rhamnose transport system ATP-binding protein